MRRMEEMMSSGIATGTQKRGSKQGEALASACFTFGRNRRQERRRGTDREEDLELEKQDKRNVRDGQQEEKSTHGVRCDNGTSGRCDLTA